MSARIAFLLHFPIFELDVSLSGGLSSRRVLSVNAHHPPQQLTRLLAHLVCPAHHSFFSRVFVGMVALTCCSSGLSSDELNPCAQVIRQIELQ